jgi:hypothetical protein
MSAIVLQKSFGRDERNFLEPWMLIVSSDVRDTSLLRKTTTDLRIGATEHRSGRVVQKSTFARFLASFDFRLLQHYQRKSRHCGLWQAVRPAGLWLRGLAFQIVGVRDSKLKTVILIRLRRCVISVELDAEASEGGHRVLHRFPR